ncbi:MAG: hypothetical protein FJX30_00305 [Alphaproteobacteria bacterium]|nr:hypothetical protein [Alphaproteobacteria bacterium]
MNKKIIILLNIALLIIANVAIAKESGIPSWFSKPRKNNIDVLYGIGEGASLEEATKNALADIAGKLVVSISSESQLTKEENQNSFNEELRQKVRQSIEKISFSGYEVSKSEEIDKRFYVEVSVERDPFINEQKERIEFLKRKINDLDKNSSLANPIQRRTSLIKILDLCKELELKGRILAGAQEEVDMKNILSSIANYQNEFEKSSSSIEFFFDNSTPKDLIQIIRTALNKDGLKIAKNFDKNDANLIVIRGNYASTSNFVYGAYITKLNVDFENFSQGKVVASNGVEVSGSSTISESEATKSAIKSMEEKIQKDGILKILGILN